MGITLRTPSSLDVPPFTAVGMETLISSLTLGSEFAQKQVGVMARAGNIMQDRGTAKLARIVYQQIAKAEQSLRDAGGDCDVLNFCERDVSSCASNQAGIDFNLGVSQRVAHEVPFDVVIGWNQK